MILYLNYIIFVNEIITQVLVLREDRFFHPVLMIVISASWKKQKDMHWNILVPFPQKR